MIKRIEKFIFPLLLTVTFVIFPLLFSFDDSSLPSYSNNGNNNSRQPIIDQFFWSKPKLLSPELENDISIPLYDPSSTSIYADGLQSIMEYYVRSTKANSLAYIRPPNLPSPSRGDGRLGAAEEFFFKNYDEYKRVTIPPTLVTNGHIGAMNQFAELPRVVTEQDFDVQFSAKRVEPMFMAHYSDYFELDVQQQFENPKPRKLRTLLGKYWRNQGKVQRNAYQKIREDLLRNKSVVKLTGCRYADTPEKVIIYYDLQTNLFCIVGQRTNNFIIGGVASLCDYIDVYYFRWLYDNKTFNQSVQFFEKPTNMNVETNSEGQVEINSEGQVGVSPYEKFDRARDKGLPNGYDPANWWDTTQQQLIEEFLRSINKSTEWYYDNLEIGDDELVTETTKIEAFTLLQLQAQNYIFGIRRPDKSNPQEGLLDTDARFEDFNRELIRDCNPTIIDVKALIDPKALISRPEERIRTLEQQLEDVTSGVKLQQDRAKDQFNETVLHVINLFRVRPADRAFVIASFKAKAIKKDVDLNCVMFLNTDENSIF